MRRTEMSRPLRIAVAGAKGGTGKTTVSANLALTVAEKNVPVAYLDCDVEEPNGHIFLNPSFHKSTRVSIPVPKVDESRCTLCGDCKDVCRFSALVALPNKVLTFPKLCHGCGGCSLACTNGAISEDQRTVGEVEEGTSRQIDVLQGKLHIGEAMAPPVIRGVLKAAPRDRILILDAPPGTSCPVIETVKSSDVTLLVTEPTPFGLNDLKLAVDMMRRLAVPFGVLVNRAGIGNDDVVKYCAGENIPVLLEIPDDRAIAEAYSRGKPIVQALPHLKPLFYGLYEKLVALADTRPSATQKSSALPSSVVESPFKAPQAAAPEAFRQPPDIPDLVVISGKGGTGKTGITASFIALSKNAAAADLDVDAADLHLVLQPQIKRQGPFSGGKHAVIDEKRCTGCGVCETVCRFDAVSDDDAEAEPFFHIDSIACEGCGVCADACPEGAVSMVPSVNGEWFVSDTRHGPMAHARLGIAEENSGKLVSLVKRKGKEAAEDNARELLICDGSPGIGCPVIASITAAAMVLIVTEPTLSGLHDMKRVATLCQTLRVKACLCVNKADINPDTAGQIEKEAAAQGIAVLGRVRYDKSVTAAQVAKKTAVEFGNGPAASDIRALFERVRVEMKKNIQLKSNETEQRK